MKAGVIGLAVSDLGRINSYTTTRTEDGEELTTRVEVTGIRQTPDGREITEGRAAAERLTEQESIQLSGEDITVTEEATVTPRYTEFFAVDGEFIVVRSGDGAFLFDEFERRYGTGVSRGRIDLDALLTAFSDATPWKVGFYGHGEDAENGVIHGENVLTDGEFGEALRTSPKNQLGLKVSRNDSTLKMVATASGYVEVYQPSNFDGNQFCEFLKKDIIPVTSP